MVKLLLSVLLFQASVSFATLLKQVTLSANITVQAHEASSASEAEGAATYLVGEYLYHKSVKACADNQKAQLAKLVDLESELSAAGKTCKTELSKEQVDQVKERINNNGFDLESVNDLCEISVYYAVAQYPYQQLGSEIKCSEKTDSKNRKNWDCKITETIQCIY